MKLAIFGRNVGDAWKGKVASLLREFVKRGALLSYYEPFFAALREYCDGEIPHGSFFNGHEDLSRDTDIFLCFGGDGTFLESITIVRDYNIPVAGLNFGRLGFLTSVDSMSGNKWIDLLFEKQFSISERSVLSISSDEMPKGFCQYALNEVSVQRRDPYMLSVFVKVDGVLLPTYWSDGIVLASPTGSTAYSLSVGGPLVLPGTRALVLTPIAPHNLNVRPMVVPDTSVIEIFTESRKREAIVSLDNRSFVIPEKKSIVVTKADFTLKYVSFAGNGFIGALREKLMWGEDRRNR
jgi:NAD+ kinase